MLLRLTVDDALQRLNAGGVVVFPTETAYGVGCRAFDPAAVARVLEAKGRPDGKPLPVLLPGVAALRMRQVESPLLMLAEAFWPGPLTLVVPAFPELPAAVTAGTGMVGVRMSAHPVAAELVERLGQPLVATSANRSGDPAASSPTACDGAELQGVDGLVEGGDVAGTASTVVGLVDGDLRIFRQGPVSEADLRAVWDPQRL